MNKIQKIIFWLFALMFFSVPLVLWPYTSEIFEFNKMVLVYTFTALIVAAWTLRSIIEKKLIFRRTILDKPLLIFLGSQLISTVISIDPLTSWLGYYSRFNGGFVSLICYSLLYWCFVSNFDTDDVYKLFNYSLLPSAFLVSFYGVLEHFGIDKNVWVQDVQTRVFSTLGQPNWLAAWLTALIPITWFYSLQNKFKSLRFWIYQGLSILFFWTLIFTKSRSGLLGFAAAFVIFWGLYFLEKRENIKKEFPVFGIILISVIAIILISGTEYTPSIKSLVDHSNQPKVQATGPALEVGGTESGTIRKIVWKGALDIWQHYPVFGTGVETFAYSYYKYRPVEHNLTSEWDFVYNKAHNEFLNVAANSGTIGLVSYLILIGTSIFIFIKELELPITNYQFPFKFKNSKFENSKLTGDSKMETGDLSFALLAGYISLLVTNFFGFSVVPTELEFFLFPAFAIVIAEQAKKQKITSLQGAFFKGWQKFAALLLLPFIFYLLVLISRYWYADTLYAKGKAYNSAGKPDVASNYLIQSINLEPNQPLYHAELANSYTTVALYYNKQKDLENTQKFANLAIEESSKAVTESSANVNLRRSLFGVYIMLSAIDPNYLIAARQTLIDAINYAPTDAKLYYNLGLTYARTGDSDKAIETFQKTIELKSNYKEARLALAYMLIDKKNYKDAKIQLEYILKNIDPNDSLTKQALESIK